MDRDIRLSPKAIRLTDEHDAPAAKRSGRVSARCTCDEVVRSPDEQHEELCETQSQEGARELRSRAARPRARRFRVAKVARGCAIFVPIAGGATFASIR